MAFFISVCNWYISVYTYPALWSSNTFRSQQTYMNRTDILYMLKMWITDLGSTALLWGKLTFLFLYRPQFALDRFLDYYCSMLEIHIQNHLSVTLFYACIFKAWPALHGGWEQTISRFLWVFPDQCRGRLENSLHAA